MTTLRTVLPTIAVVAVAGLVTAGCTDSRPAPSARGSATNTAFSIVPGDGPEPDPAGFTAVVDNPWFPLPVGARWRFEGTSDGRREVVEIAVTDRTRQVMGVQAVVVRDTVTVDGQLAEDTYDWFAQDRDGNVWYLGEEVKDYERGRVVSTAGSWEAGVDGARPGIVMPADPRRGDAYRQEFLAGEAEDMMRIARTGASVSVPAGTFDDVVATEDWTPLEPEVVERKEYARGVGKVRETTTAGGKGHVALVSYQVP